jgi:trk system potassium uptake protein TrkH
MLPRFSKNDCAVVAHYLGMLVMMLAVFMLVPLAISLVAGEWEVSVHYVLGMGVALALGALLRLAKISPGRLEHKQAIAITGLLWIVGALVAAVPLYLSGHYMSPLDAIFEGVSGLTATGLTMVQDVDHMALADNMWRFALQFLGGQGVIVIALSLGLFSRTGTSLYNTEGRSESILPNIRKTSQFIWRFAVRIVILGTIVLGVILMLLGVDPARSLLHGLWITIGTYDTGGFAPQSLSLMYYHSWPLESIAMIFMMFGAVNFALLAQVHNGKWREFVRDIEIRTLALWITGMVVVFVAVLCFGDFLTDYSGLMRRGVFTIISATTNTGYQLLSTNQLTTLFSSGAFFLIAISMAIGGSSVSTAGGIKPLRVGLICKGIGLRIRSMLLPPSAQVTTSYNHIGRHHLTAELLSSALIIAALYVVTYVMGALVGIACGYDALEATFESISAASNAGLSSGIAAPDAPAVLKIFYILQMWMGRLEFLTLLALFASLFASLVPRRKARKAHKAREAKRGGKRHAR